MAEKIVSPGVFTEEKDLSFLPQGIANIGAAFVGPTVKGPAMVPISVTSYGEFVQIFGDTNPNLYLPYTAKEYLNNSGQLTVVRTLHDDGYSLASPIAVVASGSFGRKQIALLHPSQVLAETDSFYDGTTNLFHTSVLTSNISGSFVVQISGSYTVDTAAFPNAKGPSSAIYSASLSSLSANYMSKVFSKQANVSSAPAYLYTFFGTAASASLAADPNCVIELQSGSFDFSDSFLEAQTPWIISQRVNGVSQNLFKLHTIADGVHANYETKIAISNIKPAGTVAGSEYGSFTLSIRAVDQTKLTAVGSPYTTTDSDVRANVLESYDNVNLDPNSARYISRVIGDRYLTFASGKVIANGDYPNKSKYVYVEVDSNVAKGVYSVELVPFGFAALYNPKGTNSTE
jgi:hypothetical protein